MAILDSRGRLFGKLSILDAGAALVILLAIIGIFFLPGKSGTGVAQVNVSTKPVEVDLLILGLSTRNPEALIQQGEETSFIIRNQPSGQAEIKSVEMLPRTVAVSQPDGSVKALPDPRPEAVYSSNYLLTLESRGQVTGSGPVIGNTKIQVGSPVRIEGEDYTVPASVLAVRVRQ